jgi:hypothetical protein
MWLTGRWSDLFQSWFEEVKSWLLHAFIMMVYCTQSFESRSVTSQRKDTSHGDVGQLGSKRGHDSISVSDRGHWERDLGKEVLLSLAHNFRDSMANYRSGLLDFLSRQADGDAHLERRRNNLLRLKVIVQRLETADKDTIRKALAESQFHRMQ